MNPITYSVSELKFRIPVQLLTIGFARKDRRSPISLDERITSEVIRPRVLTMCDLVGGREITIPLYSITPEHLDAKTVEYAIPLSLTQGSPIVSVKNITYIPTGLSTFGMQGLYAQGSELARAAGGVMNSHAMIPLVSTARVTIIGENIIEVRDDNAYIPHHSLIAVISNDPWMNNLHRRSFPVFAKAVELAVKSFLYNKLIIDFDEAFLRQGQSMDTVKAAVEQYADAETMFQEHMTTTMPKVLFMNDERQWHRWIRSQISISS